LAGFIAGEEDDSPRLFRIPFKHIALLPGFLKRLSFFSDEPFHKPYGLLIIDAIGVPTVPDLR
jgi:hypothetical protein